MILLGKSHIYAAYRISHNAAPLNCQIESDAIIISTFFEKSTGAQLRQQLKQKKLKKVPIINYSEIIATFYISNSLPTIAVDMGTYRECYTKSDRLLHR